MNMQINLRKANAIQSELRRAIGGVNTKTDIVVNEFTADVEGTLSKGALEFKQALERKEALNKALYQIRAAVGRANVESGISDVLADVELIDAQIAINNVVVNTQPRKDVSEINARIVKMKQTPVDARSALYGERYNNVDTTVVSETDIVAAKATVKMLKRERQGLADKLLQLNVNTLIQLSDPTKLTLQEEFNFRR
jgi:hypothetical protein